MKTIKKSGLLGLIFVFCLVAVCLLFIFGVYGTSAPESDDVFLSSLSFFVPNTVNSDGQNINLWHDETDNTYYCFLPSHTGKTVQVSLESGRYIQLSSGEKFNNNDSFEYAVNTLYNVELFSKSGALVENMKIIFMKSEKVASAFVELSVPLSTVHENKTIRQSGNMTIVLADGDIEYNAPIKLFGRGNYSWSTPKKTYSINLDSAASLLGLSTTNKYAFIVNYLDESFVRNKLALDLAGDVGMKYSSDSEFVVLYINNEYCGLFQLCERIEVSESSVNITDLESQNKSLNRQRFENIAAYKFETETSMFFDLTYNPADITGGYLLEREASGRYMDEESGFITEGGECIVIKSPTYATGAEVEYISGVFATFERALLSGGYDAESGLYLSEIIDMESWARRYIIDEFFMNYDAGLNSCYFYKDIDSVSTLIYAGPVWDYDHCLRNSYMIHADEHDGVEAQLYATKKTIWYEALYNNEEFYAEIVYQYHTYFLPILEEYLETKIDAEIDKVYAAAQLDYVRWTDGERNRYRWFGDLDQQREDLKTIFKTRIDYLASVWAYEEE